MSIISRGDLDDFINIFDDHVYDDDKVGIFQSISNCVLGSDFIIEYSDIKISKSTKHGLGVFATKNIPKGVIITLYPIDAFQLLEDDDEYHYVYQNNNDKFISNYGEYLNIYTLSGNSSLVGEFGITGDPNKINNKLFIGHMINDSIGNCYQNIPLSELESNNDLTDSIINKYSCMENINCSLEMLPDIPLAYVITERDIKKGEELLTSYGEKYWYCHEYHNKISSYRINIL